MKVKFMNDFVIENSEVKFAAPLPNALNMNIFRTVFSFHNRIQILLMKVSSSKILSLSLETLSN